MHNIRCGHVTFSLSFSEMCSYLKGHVIRLSLIHAVFADREHCQQPDHDSPSHLRGHPDIPWRPRVPLHLLFPRTGRLVRWLCINAVIVARTCLWQLLRAVAQYLQQMPNVLTLNVCVLCVLFPLPKLLVLVPGASTWRCCMRCRWAANLNMSAKAGINWTHEHLLLDKMLASTVFLFFSVSSFAVTGRVAYDLQHLCFCLLYVSAVIFLDQLLQHSPEN